MLKYENITKKQRLTTILNFYQKLWILEDLTFVYLTWHFLVFEDREEPSSYSTCLGFMSRYHQKIHWVHALYVLVIFVVPKIVCSVFSSLPCVLSLRDCPFPSETKENCGRADRWCYSISSKAEVRILPLYVSLAFLGDVPPRL